MQGVGDDAANPPEPQRSRRGGLSPYAAGAVVLALIVGAGLVFYLTNPDAEPLTPGSQTIPNSEPNPATGAEPLTEAEAIETFRELALQSVIAVQERDLNALVQALEEGSPAFERSAQAIRELKRDGITDESRFRISKVTVVNLRPEKVRLLADTLIRPCFRDAQGNDVTDAPRKLARRSVWTISATSSGWRISEAVIRNEQTMGRGQGDC